ncbi:MAG: hypothetical protein IJ379_13905 [Lachnospiraceae bacterium]|nr:hypothetical protein [Lachnospiraceae bacterium]
MRIIIENIQKKLDNRIMVTCSTDIGKIKGNWKSHAVPRVGAEYHAELTLPPLKREDISVLKERNLLPSVQVSSEGKVHFQGQCEVVDEDDIHVIRYAVDWIDMVEISSVTIAEGDWVAFSMESEEIDIYPYF